MADGQFERVETDSVIDLQLSVADSLELGAVADERASDADFREASDIFDEDIGVAGIVGAPDVVAESPTSIPVTQRPSTSERREVSSMSERIIPQWSGRIDVESLGDGHQAPVNVRGLPLIAMAGAGDFRSNVSVPRVEGPQYTPSGDASLAKVDNSIRPRSTGSGRDQVQQGGYVDAPPVAIGSLFGQLGYAGPVAGTSMVARHVNPIDASVLGPRFVATPPQSISTPIVSQPISEVQQVAMPPVQIAVSASGGTGDDGTGVVPPPTVQSAGYPTTSVSSFGAAVPSGFSVNTLGVPVPSGTAVTSVSLVPSVPQVPVAPMAPPMPPVSSAVSIASAYSHSSLSGGVSQTVHRSVGPGVNGVIPRVSDPGQVMLGGYVPNSAGYIVPWMWSASGPAPVGSVGTYGWPGESFLLWVSKLPQAGSWACQSKPGELHQQAQIKTRLQTRLPTRPQLQVLLILPQGCQVRLFPNQMLLLMLQEAMLPHP